MYFKTRFGVEQASGLFRRATSPSGASAASCRPRRAGSPFHPFLKHALSDEQAQFQILDRRSFHEFLGWTVADRVPEQNTIREFREKLTQAELFSALFAAFNTG